MKSDNSHGFSVQTEISSCEWLDLLSKLFTQTVYIHRGFVACLSRCDFVAVFDNTPVLERTRMKTVDIRKEGVFIFLIRRPIVTLRSVSAS